MNLNKNKSKAFLLQKLYEPYKECVSCPLSIPTKHNVVWGKGNPEAKLMLIGEAPGKYEDEQGIPFVGKSGMLLTKALTCLDIDREKDVFITNSVKCRPPKNRKPTPQESKTYKQLLLLKEIEIIKPKVICTLGATALECLLEEPVKMSDLHGKNLSFDNIILIPTYHPAYILRSPQNFEPWFRDLEKAWTLARSK
jgi:uracil-DNA glycosylase